ncbi:MAG: type II toxin-antitoxin system YoeB family toxin [Candidatus Amoebophilus sp.]
MTTKENTAPTKLSFLDDKQEKVFLAFREKEENKNNIEKVLADIKLHAWKITGSGKPEVLKHPYKGYRGCISHRLTHKDRIIYKITGKGTILMSWEGHYRHQ